MLFQTRQPQVFRAKLAIHGTDNYKMKYCCFKLEDLVMFKARSLEYFRIVDGKYEKVAKSTANMRRFNKILSHYATFQVLTLICGQVRDCSGSIKIDGHSFFHEHEPVAVSSECQRFDREY
jgi:hypothetical protein